MKKILYWPLTRIIIGLIVCVGSVLVVQYSIGAAMAHSSIDKTVARLLQGLIVAAVAILSYTLLFRSYEKREITELSPRHLLRNLLAGFFIGAFLQSLTILVIYLCGYYTVISVNPVILVLSPLTMSVTSGIFEEILLRGIVFRITEEKLGSYPALAISALLFGLLHLGNPGATFVVAIGLALQAGVLLAAAYMYAGNLWFPIAIHFAWNFTQSAIFGASVSGGSMAHSLVSSHISGNPLITGGEFGPEGSVQATLFCFAAALILLILCHRQGKIRYYRQRAA